MMKAKGKRSNSRLKIFRSEMKWTSLQLKSTLVLTFFSFFILVIHGAYLPPYQYNGGNMFADLRGDYCAARIGGCCPGRIDDCSVPILGTLCYCDSFCNRTDNPDCCPDYYSACLGIHSLKPPEEFAKPRCFYNGHYVEFGSAVKINCNQCKCEKNPSDPTQFELLCERDTCLMDETLVETINEGDYPWSAANYTDFWGRKLSDALLYRLGTLEPDRGVKHMEPIRFVYDEKIIPRNFDARTKWPNLIHGVKDQGWCGSDWAFVLTSITADRLAIQSKGLENLELSPQHILSCNTRGQQGCTGAHLDRAWNFMRKFGVVDETCYPYESGNTNSAGNCLISRKVKSLLEINQCRSGNRVDGRTELYRSQPAYKISRKENDIKYEIMTFGPVHGVMAVFPDFFIYRGGVYKKSGLKPGERTGYHSVKILGWGEEFHQGEMVKYWLVANSWGSSWGENGYFKILRGENECEIESFVVAAWARTTNGFSYRKKHPFF